MSYMQEFMDELCEINPMYRNCINKYGKLNDELQYNMEQDYPDYLKCINASNELYEYLYERIIRWNPKLICTGKKYTSCNFRIQFKGTIFDNENEMVIDVPYYWIRDTSYIVYKTKLIDMDGEYYKNDDYGVMHYTIDEVVSEINRVLQIEEGEDIYPDSSSEK